MLKRLVKCLGVVWVSFAMSLGLTIPAFAAVNFGAAHYKYMEPSLTYKYRNGYSYSQMGYYYADCESWMWVKNQGRSVGSGAIMSQAGMTVYDVLAQDHVIWGPSVTNSGSNPDGFAIESYLYYCLNAPDGAVSWGYGIVRRPDTTYLEIGTEENYLGSLGSWGVYSRTGGIAKMSDGAIVMGDDGLSYGVPFEDETGILCMPDMVRVKLNESSYGYVCYDELVNAAFNGASSEEELGVAINTIDQQKAQAIESAINTFFGCDLISSDQARNLVDALSLQNGRENMRSQLESDIAPALAQKINDGILSDDAAAIVLGESLELKGCIRDGANVDSKAGVLPSDDALKYIEEHDFDAIKPRDIHISADVVREVISMARSSVAYAIPVYDEGGTVLGTYHIDRI